MVTKKPEHTIKCDLCHGKFRLTKDVLKEEQVTLHQEGLDPHEVRLTYLYCPLCGKRYPVIMDDETTLPLLEKLRKVLAKQVKLARKGAPKSAELERKHKDLNWKLDFRRQ